MEITTPIRRKISRRQWNLTNIIAHAFIILLSKFTTVHQCKKYKTLERLYWFKPTQLHVELFHSMMLSILIWCVLGQKHRELVSCVYFEIFYVYLRIRNIELIQFISLMKIEEHLSQIMLSWSVTMYYTI